MNGIITDIQKFSLHDGAGIRTTVFFKGCNMRCNWCHNPETLSMEPQKAFYEQKCIHCGHCNDCPTGARVTIGRSMSAAEVFEEISSDIPYYLASGGGITLSGGEPTLQADFAAELLILCKQAGVPTAIETNLSLPFERWEKLLPLLNHVFFDIKVFDDTLHREVTGISNRTTLENTKKLAELGIPATLRTPLIPGITATEGNIAAIARFAAGLPNVDHYELLNFNPLGEGKYKALGMENLHAGERPFSKDFVAGLARIAEAEGVKAVFGQE